MTWGSSLGGREIKSGAAGNSSSAGWVGWSEGSVSVAGTGSEDFFIQLQIAIFQEQLPNFFRLEIDLINTHQPLDILKILKEPMPAGVFKSMKFKREQML